jgi:hypothetical protein
MGIVKWNTANAMLGSDKSLMHGAREKNMASRVPREKQQEYENSKPEIH